MQKALGGTPAILVHAAFETYSVLTRIPEPDGLIAITAASNDATLVTLGQRALPTYLLVGADLRLVG